MAVNVTQRDMLLREIMHECDLQETEVYERRGDDYDPYTEGYQDAVSAIYDYCYQKLSRKERETVDHEESMKLVKRLEETETL